MAAGTSGGGDARGRGQTTLDYAVGVASFLIVVGFVFAFIPSIVGPFTAEPSDRPLIADRSADQLSQDMLIDAPTAYSLNATCTEGFFDADGAAPDGCRFGMDAEDLPAALNVSSPGVSFNVTIRDGNGTIREVGDANTRLAAGGTPRPGANVVSAKRVVLLDDTRGYLKVRVW
ncbi:DUF7287 family protein [Haloparvum sp. PAK95]|uniref:DUF7287 family protein n=1 Tax=Haloparvum sp. PAK95 TaxID=3418962 RepID=UPI003D2ED195